MPRDQDKAPAYQWYPKDYDSDEAVKLMTYEQEGIYRRLLDHQAINGSLPSDPIEIAMLVPKVPQRRFLALWPRIAEKFGLVDGRLVNQKLKRVKEDFTTFIETKARSGQVGGKRSAETRRERYGSAQPNKYRSTSLAPTEAHTEAHTEAPPEANSTAPPKPASASATAKEQERAREQLPTERLVDAFRAHWQRTYGHECSLILSPLEFFKVEQQVSAHDIERLLVALDGYFMTTENYVRNARHPLALFLRDPFKYLAKMAAEPVSVPRGCKHQPPCKDAAAHTTRDQAELRRMA